MILAGDIGGTNSRLALFDVQDGRLVKQVDARVPSRDAKGLRDIIATFLREHGARPAAATLGLPGPVKRGRVVTTNLPWVVEVAELRAGLGLERTHLLNDLESYAWGVAALGPDDLETLHAGAPEAEGNRAVIAAGTGLGQAGLYWDGRRHHPYPTEGGHADFAPADERQFGLRRFLAERHGRVGWERVVSGPGLVNVYEYLRDVARVAEPREIPPELVSPDRAATITQAALAGACPVAEAALDLFVVLYGREAGNLALKTLALGGLYLGGGIAPRILPKLREPAFMQSFLDKDRMRELLEGIPVRVIVNEDCGLIGAARHAALQLGALTD